MGDRCFLSITIRGHIATVAALNDVCRAIEAQHLHSDGHATVTAAFVEAVVRGENPEFYDDDINYANIDGLEDVLQKYGIGYSVSHGSGSGYSAGEWAWSKDGRYEASCTEDGTTVIELEPLKRASKESAPHAALLQLIEHADRACGNHLPSFSVGEKVKQAFANEIAKAALGIKETA